MNRGSGTLSTQELERSVVESMVQHGTTSALVRSDVPVHPFAPTQGGAVLDPDRPYLPARKSARFQDSSGLRITPAVDSMEADDDSEDDDASTQEGDATWEEYDGYLADASVAASPGDFLAALADALDVADFLAVDVESTQRLSDSLVTSVSRYFRKSRGLPPPPATSSGLPPFPRSRPL